MLISPDSGSSKPRRRSTIVVLPAPEGPTNATDVPCSTLKEAESAVQDMLEGASFGDSGREVVIEEFLEGEEASLHLICSGENYVTLPMSQDHKKVGEGDTGPNTGGMGAYAPT